MSTPATVAEPSVPHERARVLVVDDDPAYRNLLAALLRRNYIVSVAEDGFSGLQQAKAHPPDIAVIDIQMPGLDGLQTLAAIRNDPQLSGMRVIMLTADASRDTVLAAVQAGAHDYFIKTAFSREEFVRKIERLLQWNPATLKPQPRSESTAVSTDTPGPAAGGPGLCHIPVSPSAAHTSTASDGVTALSPPVDGHLQEILDSWD